MDALTLTGFLSRNSIGTGNLKAFYSFYSQGLFSPRVIFNNLYPTGVQIKSGAEGYRCINTDYYPAISVKDTSPPVNENWLVSGSGSFKGSDILKVYRPVSSGDWTIFFNINRPQLNSTHEPEAIFSDSLSGNSGLIFGVNDSNKFFVEFKNANAERTIFSSENELANRQVASLSKTSESIYLSIHDRTSRKDTEEVFDLNGSSEAYSWFFGGIQSGSAEYVGYSGYIDDLVLFDTFLDKKTRDLISKVFFITGQSLISESSNLTAKIATGININPTGNIGTGITGYQSQTIDTINSVEICQTIGKTGVLTGQVITFLTGENPSSGSQQSSTRVVDLYNYDYFKKFTKNNILFTKFINPGINLNILNSPTPSGMSGSYLEVFSQEIPDDNLNFKGIPNPSERGYSLPSGYKTGNLNVFLGGKALYSGTDYEILDSNSIKIKVPYSGREDFIYDVVSGTQYVCNLTGINSHHLLKEAFSPLGFSILDSGNYLFFNGKKLIEGRDYTLNTAGNQVDNAIDFAIGVTGVLLSLPKPLNEKLIEEHPHRDNGPVGSMGDPHELFANKRYDLYTSFAAFNNSILLDERVWLDGLRQQREKDYIKTPYNSLLNTETFIYSNGNPIYSNDNKFFNI